MTSLYIHIPFCQSKCLFCSFVVAVGKEHRIDAYLESLEREAAAYRGTEAETVYVGGGTPTWMEASQLRRLVSLINDNFKCAPGAEFTVEANPENIEISKARFLNEAGVNRISLGVQSLDDRYLNFLGRRHDSPKALAAFRILREAGFSNVNLDLMFSFPAQSLEEIAEDAGRVASLGSEHLSLYALTIEEGSRFFRQNMKLDNDEKQAEAYSLVVDVLEKQGFRQYEISNFAKPGRESRHNRVYWEGGNYIGLGIGAHSHKDGERFWNTPNLMGYLEKMKEGISPVDGREALDPEARLAEALLFGLRMNEGVRVDFLEERYKAALSDGMKEKIDEFIAEGFLTREKSRLCATPKGRLLLDEICAQLI